MAKLAGTYGDATHVAQVTINDCGHVEKAANVPIAVQGGGSGRVPVQSFGIELGDGRAPIAPHYAGIYQVQFTGRITGCFAISCDEQYTRGSIDVELALSPFDAFPNYNAVGHARIDHALTGEAPLDIPVTANDVLAFTVISAEALTKVLVMFRAVQS